MILPEANQTTQQIGPAEKCTILRAAAADDHMIPAASARRTPIELEFLRAQPRLPRHFIKLGRILDQFSPRPSRMDIDLDHARVRSYLQHRKPRVKRRGV